MPILSRWRLSICGIQVRHSRLWIRRRAIAAIRGGTVSTAPLAEHDGCRTRIPITSTACVLAPGFPLLFDHDVHQTVPDGADDDRAFRSDRSLVQHVSHRPLCDAMFASGVERAYDTTCPVSGLPIVNGRRRAGAKAAHIRPVKDDGPYSVSNGLALSASVHWMFDRGLVSVDDEFMLLITEESISESALTLISPHPEARAACLALGLPPPVCPPSPSDRSVQGLIEYGAPIRQQQAPRRVPHRPDSDPCSRTSVTPIRYHLVLIPTRDVRCPDRGDDRT